MATDQTRRMLSGWAATLAATVTGGIVLLMHLRGAPLASASAGRVLTAALVAAALLAPLYLLLFKLVWRMGLPEILSPWRWARIVRDTKDDLALLHALSHFHERHGKDRGCDHPGPPPNPHGTSASTNSSPTRPASSRSSQPASATSGADPACAPAN